MSPLFRTIAPSITAIAVLTVSQPLAAQENIQAYCNVRIDPDKPGTAGGKRGTFYWTVGEPLPGGKPKNFTPFWNWVIANYGVQQSQIVSNVVCYSKYSDVHSLDQAIRVENANWARLNPSFVLTHVRTSFRFDNLRLSGEPVGAAAGGNSASRPGSTGGSAFAGSTAPGTAAGGRAAPSGSRAATDAAEQRRAQQDRERAEQSQRDKAMVDAVTGAARTVGTLLEERSREKAKREQDKLLAEEARARRREAQVCEPSTGNATGTLRLGSSVSGNLDQENGCRLTAKHGIVHFYRIDVAANQRLRIAATSTAFSPTLGLWRDGFPHQWGPRFSYDFTAGTYVVGVYSQFADGTGPYTLTAEVANDRVVGCSPVDTLYVGSVTDESLQRCTEPGYYADQNIRSFVLTVAESDTLEFSVFAQRFAPSVSITRAGGTMPMAAEFAHAFTPTYDAYLVSVLQPGVYYVRIDGYVYDGPSGLKGGPGDSFRLLIKPFEGAVRFHGSSKPAEGSASSRPSVLTGRRFAPDVPAISATLRHRGGSNANWDLKLEPRRCSIAPPESAPNVQRELKPVTLKGVVKNGTRDLYMSFGWRAPKNGWPVGTYVVSCSTKSSEVGRGTFEITSG